MKENVWENQNRYIPRLKKPQLLDSGFYGALTGRCGQTVIKWWDGRFIYLPATMSDEGDRYTSSQNPQATSAAMIYKTSSTARLSRVNI